MERPMPWVMPKRHCADIGAKMRPRYPFFAGVLVLVSALVVLGACEQAFTTSPLSWLERDPDNMSKDQQIRYAEDALRSGSKSSARKAYDALSKNVDADDPAELNLLLADLAMNASGFADTTGDLLELAFAEDLGNADKLAEQLEPKLGDLDYDYVLKAKEQIDQVHAKGETASEQAYLEVGLALAMRAANANDGSFDPDDGDEWGDAKDFAAEAATRLDDSDLLSDFDGYLN